MKNLVIVPAYNEEEALPQTLESLFELGHEFELLVVNDGSTDGSESVVRRFAGAKGLHIATLPVNLGIGGAVQTGYRFAAMKKCYQYVIQCDADGQHDVASIPRLVDMCEQRQLDLCVGSRFMGQPSDGFQSTSLRRIGIRILAWLISTLTGTRVTDPTSGLRCVGPRVWHRLAEQYPDDFPEPESLFWCIRNGFRVHEVPVTMRERQHGQSSISNVRGLYYMAKVGFAILIDRLRVSEGGTP